MAGSTRLRSREKRAVGGYKSYVEGGVQKASLSDEEGGGYKSYGRRRGLFVCFFSLRNSAGKNGSLATLVLLLFSFSLVLHHRLSAARYRKRAPFPFLLLQSSQKFEIQSKRSRLGVERKERTGKEPLCRVNPRSSSCVPSAASQGKRSVISSVGFVNRSVLKLVFGFRSGFSPSLLLLCPSRNPKSGGEKQRKEEHGKKSNFCFQNPCSAVSQGAAGEKTGDCTCWLWYSKLN